VVHVDALDLVERETQPPRPYTDATLLAAMKSAGREIEDEALAQAMKGSGLGTPATRAETIEKLIRTGYVERERKQLRATPKGRALIGLVAEPLRSAELTAAWEQQLKEVEDGGRSVDAFYADIVAFVRDLIPRVAEGPAMTVEQVAAAGPAGSGTRGGGRGKTGQTRSSGAKPAGLGSCPTCGSGVLMETARAFGCSRYREGCGFVVWKEVAGVTLTKAQVGLLLKHGVTERIEGFRSKSGRVFAARLKLGEGGKVSFDFSDGPPPGASGAEAPGPRGQPAGTAPPPVSEPAPVEAKTPLACPKCGQGRIIEGRGAFGCDRWREGCHLVIPKEVAGRRLTQAQLRDLVQKRRTRPIQGLRDAEGHPCTARLSLNAAWELVLEPVAPT
jgi:DNA topoisomerase-3